MDFIVLTTTDDDTFTGDATYKIKDAVLTVDDGAGTRHVYSPSAWLRVIDTTPRGSGKKSS